MMPGEPPTNSRTCFDNPQVDRRRVLSFLHTLSAAHPIAGSINSFSAAATREEIKPNQERNGDKNLSA